MTARRIKRGRPTMSAAAILKAVDAERDNLGRAISLLSCLAVAIEHGDDLHTGPCYYEVVELARDMVDISMTALEPSVLTGKVSS